MRDTPASVEDNGDLACMRSSHPPLASPGTAVHTPRAMRVTPRLGRRAAWATSTPLLLLLACNGSPSQVGPKDGGTAIDAHVGKPDAGHKDAAVADVTLDYKALPYDGLAPDAGPARTPVTAEVVSNRADVRQLLFAGGEMQISGEPFASGFAGRNLSDYDRNYLPPDMYILNLGQLDQQAIVDLFGFSTAVESYEYSKYYMNMVVQETTAGVSLANGPVVALGPGATPFDQLVLRMNDLLASAGTNLSGEATLPAPVGNASDYLGFPGQWPAFAPFADFDPAMTPTPLVVAGCVYTGGYKNLTLAASSPAYECNYNTTHLTDPIGQVDRTLLPTVLGYAAWKEAIWAIDFAGRIHDANGVQVATVPPGTLPLIGKAGNTVQAIAPIGSAVGTFIGSSPVEGMWGMTMLANMDNAAEWLRASLLTSDGVTLTGLSPMAALSYDYTSPLVWFPAAITVTEDDSMQPFPPVTNLAIAPSFTATGSDAGASGAASSSEGLAALLLGHAMFFGMTDPRNAGVGQRIGLLATFDGDPFPADDGLADGEATAHDRALEILRIAFIDLDRMHADPTLGVVMDTASVSGQTVTRGPQVTTSQLTHVLIGLRQTLLSVNAAITQYGAADPDPNVDSLGILNPLAIHPTYGLDAGATPTFSTRVRQVFTDNAQFVLDVLTKADGSVANGATVAGGVATPLTTTTTLEAQSAAVRAMVEAFLLTGDATYQVRAQAIARHLIGPAFWSATGLLYRGLEGGADQVNMTPELFGFLQSSLRESYKSLYVPGDAALDRSVLGSRIARVNKLYLNGWDDLNGNQTVDWPAECLIRTGTPDGGVGGGLQQAEQALTGEIGIDPMGSRPRDRDHDCVPELSHAKVASVLAANVSFHSP